MLYHVLCYFCSNCRIVVATFYIMSFNIKIYKIYIYFIRKGVINTCLAIPLDTVYAFFMFYYYIQSNI